MVLLPTSPMPRACGDASVLSDSLAAADASVAEHGDLKGVLEVAEVTERQGNRWGKRGAAVYENRSMALPAQSAVKGCLIDMHSKKKARSAVRYWMHVELPRRSRRYVIRHGCRWERGR